MKASRVHLTFASICLCVVLAAPARASTPPPIGRSLEVDKIYAPEEETIPELRGGGSSSGDPWPEGMEPIPGAARKLLELLRDGMNAAGQASPSPPWRTWLRARAEALDEAISVRERREAESRGVRARRAQPRAR